MTRGVNEPRVVQLKDENLVPLSNNKNKVSTLSGDLTQNGEADTTMADAFTPLTFRSVLIGAVELRTSMCTAEAKRPAPKHPAMEKPNLLFTHTESVAERRQVVNSPKKSNLNCRDKASDFPKGKWATFRADFAYFAHPISPISRGNFAYIDPKFL